MLPPNRSPKLNLASLPPPAAGSTGALGNCLLGAARLNAAVFVYLCLCVGGICQESTIVRAAKTADQALHDGDYRQAIIDYKEVLQLEPSSAAAWSNLGSAWFASGNLPRATDSFLHAARLQPANLDYAFNAALSLVREDKCDTANKYLTRSLNSDQHKTGALYLQGLCAFVSGAWLEAKEDLIKAESGGSQTAETYYMLSIAARRSDDPNQAKRAFELLRSRFPEASLLHELIGEVSDQEFMGTEARKEMSMAIASGPAAAGLHAKLGFLLWKDHQLSDAKEMFEQELTIDPHSYSAMRYLGDIAEQNNQLPQALDWYKRALREMPESGESHFAVGRVLELQGRYRDALRELRASFPALNADASAHYWTARAMKKLGMEAQARMEMAKVQQINQAERNTLMGRLSKNE